MTRSPAAFGLLALFLAGCEAGTTSTPDDLGQHYSDRESAEAATKRVSGPDIEVCTDIAWDANGDGTLTSDEYAMVYGLSADGDPYAVEPWDATDIYAPNEASVSWYICSFQMPAGYVEILSNEDIGADCDDEDVDVNPDATDIADDGIDQDCDGSDSMSDPDSDSDGFPASTDCDDGNPDVNPGATEMCNGVDDDCYGGIDDDPADASTYHLDFDGDGYGEYAGVGSASTVEACEVPEGYVDDGGTDCDDEVFETNPGATEVCDGGIDNDCNGYADDADAGTAEWSEDVFYADTDSDGYGSSDSAYACEAPEGYVENADDCDDETWATNPGASEECNGIDDNCTEGIDEGVTTTAYPDTDGDTYGAGAASEVCEIGSGWSATNDDCDDSEAGVNPGESETLDNGVDDNCDGVSETTPVDNDGDGDGYDSVGSGGTDCDDGNILVNPGMTEIAGNGTDDDCNGGAEVAGDGIDNDGDGVVEGEELCADPISGVDTLSSELYASNFTNDPNVLETTGVSGVGTLCWESDFTVGEQWKVNAPVNGGVFWLIMTDADNLDEVTFSGMAPSAEEYFSWSDGSVNGRDTVVTVPAYPGE